LRIIDEFKAGEYDIFIGNPAAAGFGLNLQLASNAFFYSNSFDVEARLQAEDRINRIGVKCACMYKDFSFKNSIDQRMTKSIVAGRSLNDYFKNHSLREIFNDEEGEEDEYK
jgi:SNF2 family DNA or RNA helicase